MIWTSFREVLKRVQDDETPGRWGFRFYTLSTRTISALICTWVMLRWAWLVQDSTSDFGLHRFRTVRYAPASCAMSKRILLRLQPISSSTVSRAIQQSWGNMNVCVTRYWARRSFGVSIMTAARNPLSGPMAVCAPITATLCYAACVRGMGSPWCPTSSLMRIWQAGR